MMFKSVRPAAKSVRLAAVLLILPMLAGCAEMYALEKQLQKNAGVHPGGEVGYGVDAALAGLQVQQNMPKRR